ncbi:uncharacterized protein LOC143583200, partial [Bidens hawaiensis]|uniref:uncharacterized protein LOC143583200 n=1 Tax=Bidens hawaiensis TaxID=980011 RepID=UPI00404A92FF
MFVKKLVEKASLKKPGGNPDGLKSDEVNPRLVYHYGPPSGCNLLAYDPIQKILAMSTIDGRIKLFGQDNTQVVLESPEAVPSKFLQFIHNQQFLININAKNHIEASPLNHIGMPIAKPISLMYVGDLFGNVSVLKFDKETCDITQMKYRIPFAASNSNSTEDLTDAAVMYILPQPAAESKRILIIYKSGLITLWSIQDSKPVFTTGGNLIYSMNHDTKKVTAACWACPFGSKVVIGYNNGEILMWSVPHSVDSKTELSTDKELSGTQSGPLFKLNLGYKIDKTPIAKLKWAYAEGK